MKYTLSLFDAAFDELNSNSYEQKLFEISIFYATLTHFFWFCLFLELLLANGKEEEKKYLLFHQCMYHPSSTYVNISILDCK